MSATAALRARPPPAATISAMSSEVLFCARSMMRSYRSPRACGEGSCQRHNPAASREGNRASNERTATSSPRRRGSPVARATAAPVA